MKNGDLQSTKRISSSLIGLLNDLKDAGVLFLTPDGEHKKFDIKYNIDKIDLLLSFGDTKKDYIQIVSSGILVWNELKFLTPIADPTTGILDLKYAPKEMAQDIWMGSPDPNEQNISNHYLTINPADFFIKEEFDFQHALETLSYCFSLYKEWVKLEEESYDATIQLQSLGEPVKRKYNKYIYDSTIDVKWSLSVAEILINQLHEGGYQAGEMNMIFSPSATGSNQFVHIDGTSYTVEQMYKILEVNNDCSKFILETLFWYKVSLLQNNWIVNKFTFENKNDNWSSSIEFVRGEN